MGKKLKKIKINKLLKRIFTNKSLVLVGAILILAVVFSNPTISKYLKPQSSEAAEWTFTKIVSGSPVAKTMDALGNKFVYGTSTTSLLDIKKIFLTSSDSAVPIPTSIPLIDSHFNINKVEMERGVVYWLQSNTIGGRDIYKYVNGVTSKITNDGGSKDGLYVTKRKMVYGNQVDNIPMKIIADITGKIIKTIYPQQAVGFTNDTDFNGNNIIWGEIEGSWPNTVSNLWMYTLSTNKFVKLTPMSTPLGPLTSVYRAKILGSTIIFSAGSPNIKPNLFSYNINTGVTKQLTITSSPMTDIRLTDYSVKQIDLLHTKVAYINWVEINNHQYQEVHLVDINNPADNQKLKSLEPAVDNIELRNIFLTSYLNKVKILVTGGEPIPAGEKKGDIYLIQQF